MPCFFEAPLNVAFSDWAVFSLIFQGSGLGAGPATVTVLTIYLALLILGNHPLLFLNRKLRSEGSDEPLRSEVRHRLLQFGAEFCQYDRISQLWIARFQSCTRAGLGG